MKPCTSQCPACGCDTLAIRRVATMDDYGIAIDPPDAWLRMRCLDQLTDTLYEEVL